MSNSNKKCLIAYYSRKGQNWVNGRIGDLAMGNTKVIAKKIQKLTGGDLFEIKTVKPYPEDYNETTRVAREELRNNARPELDGKIENIDKYDLIYLGYPNWWNTFPMAVFTFLEKYDFSEKTIIPFCTHEGSGIGRSESDIKKLCSGAKILPGIAIYGSAVDMADGKLKNWLEKQQII